MSKDTSKIIFGLIAVAIVGVVFTLFHSSAGTQSAQVVSVTPGGNAAPAHVIPVTLPPPPPVSPPPPPTGNARVKRVGADLSTASAPAGTQAWVDTSTPQSANPADFLNLTLGIHTVFATDAPGYTESVGLCSYPIGGAECSVTIFPVTPNCDGTSCNTLVTVSANNVTKVVYRYLSSTQPPPPPVSPPPPSTGNARIKRVGSDLTVNTAPAGTQAWVDALPHQSANPADFINLPIGSHTAFTTFVAGYTVGVGICSYPIGGTECSVPTFSTTNLTCNTSSCFVPITVASGNVTKIVYRYR